MIGALMLDIASTTLSAEDIEILQAPQVGGLILFARNIENPSQVHALTNHIRQIRPEILIAVDQEGGRVCRLKSQHGFSPLPAMGRFGELYQREPQRALQLAQTCGWLMATEVLAVGIDFSFAPVLDLDQISDVIGDRAFGKNSQDIIVLAAAFMQGMKRAGMAATGKHFPGHGSVKADSHIAAAVDTRSLAEIEQQDLQPFQQLMPMLDAIMPAHVIYSQVDENPAGFSTFWIQQMLRKRFAFDGVVFSDDLSMQAACVAGGADARILAALQAGCDMGLVCNDRQAALLALQALQRYPSLAVGHQARLQRMQGKGQTDNDKEMKGEVLNLANDPIIGHDWQMARQQIDEFLQSC